MQDKNVHNIVDCIGLKIGDNVIWNLNANIAITFSFNSYFACSIHLISTDKNQTYQISFELCLCILCNISVTETIIIKIT